MPQFHPESPDVSASALARLRFVADFRKQLHGGLSKGNRALYDLKYAGRAPTDLDRAGRRLWLRERMESEPFFCTWSSLLRSSQDLMWRFVGQAVDADGKRLAERLTQVSADARGSLALPPAFEGPSYLAEADIHRMPGGYLADDGATDLRAGALYDLGGAVYQFGIGNMKGGLLNDSRGRTLVAHLTSRYPNLKPTRILDLGCGVGHNTVPIAAAFPDAEVHGVDAGAALVRYAHLRAEGLGVTVHFGQDDAEHTRFPDHSFDLVVSQIVMHETSPEAMVEIFNETRRLLRLGGVMVHLEVPLRTENGDDFYNMIMLWEEYYNAEPNISAVMDMDLLEMARRAGMQDVVMGYQKIPAPGSCQSEFSHEGNDKPFGQWLIVSGTAA